MVLKRDRFFIFIFLSPSGLGYAEEFLLNVFTFVTNDKVCGRYEIL